MGSSPSPSRPALSRRAFFGTGAASLGLLAIRPAFASLPAERPRQLTFTNLHTGESLKAEYWAEGSYQPQSLDDIARVLRDHRSNKVHPIKTELLDLLHHLYAKLDAGKPFHVISGYRSPESNAKLAAASGGVAKRSLHMDGMAIDVRVPGVELRNLQKAAKALAAGGVGFYEKSNFVHVDVGRVRYW
jgi:uncharacterized protein YcbK (DUF882 family)